MPRVKFIYIGNGEWVKPTADFHTCSHPRDKLRFDSRYSLPIACYCMACGRAYIHPFHGLTEEEIAHRKRWAEETMKLLDRNDDDA